MLPDLLTIKEVVDRLKVSKSTVRRLGQAGELSYTLVGKRRCWRFFRESVESYIMRNTPSPMSDALRAAYADAVYRECDA